jgi:hypothetical protein
MGCAVLSKKKDQQNGATKKVQAEDGNCLRALTCLMGAAGRKSERHAAVEMK